MRRSKSGLGRPLAWKPNACVSRDRALHHEVEPQRPQDLAGAAHFGRVERLRADDAAGGELGQARAGREDQVVERQVGGSDLVEREERTAGREHAHDPAFAQAPQRRQVGRGEGAIGAQQGPVQVGDEEPRRGPAQRCELFPDFNHLSSAPRVQGDEPVGLLPERGARVKPLRG